MKDIYVQYARYNLWANERLTSIFSALTEEQADQHIESSFPSVKKTVLHIWDAQVIWLKRLKGIPIDEFPSKYFEGSSAEAIKGLIESSMYFLEHIESMEEEDLRAEHTFKTISSGEYAHSAAEMIHHCMNHSTYHRGQLTTFARQLGLKNLPSTDMIFYLRK